MSVHMYNRSDTREDRSQSCSTPDQVCQGTSNEHSSRKSLSLSISQGLQEIPKLAAADTAIRVDSPEETIITNICANEVASGLRRVPVGFYAVIHHSDLQWKTENKALSINSNVVEWTVSIPIPSDPSVAVCLEVYASFEFQPVLGVGEQLRKMSVVVEQLLSRSAQNIPFTFSPRVGDVVSPCSAISVTVERWKCKSSHSSTSIADRVQCPATKSTSDLEDATDEGHSALSRYRRHGERRDLDQSIEFFEQALRICQLDHPCRAAAQSNLAMAKLVHSQVVGTNASLDVPLNIYRDALVARPVGHIDRPSTLIHMAAVHIARFERSRGEVDEARAVVLLHEAMELSSAESYQNQAAGFMLQLNAALRTDPLQPNGQSPVVRDPPSCLTYQDLEIISDRLLERFEQFGDLADLQQGISILEQSIRFISFWDVRYCQGRTSLGLALLRRFKHLGELLDLEDAISMLKEVVELTSDGHSDKPVRLNILGTCLIARFERLGKMGDLNDAISILQHVVDITPRSHADKPSFLNNLGISFRARFERLGDLSDLEDAISTIRDIVTLTPHDHPNKHIYLNNLGSALFSRFKSTGVLSDIKNAISTYRDAVDSAPLGHRDKPMLLNNLSTTFFSRFEYLGELDDLEDAISTLKSAVSLIFPGHPQKHNYLNNLGTFLRVRFERLGELSNLEDAISILKNAVHLTPHDDPDKPRCLSNLGNCFINHFQSVGVLRDLEDGIARLSDAVALTPHGDPRKLVYLSNLGNSLFIRFRSTGELRDLEDAISMQKDVIELTPHGHPEMPLCLSNLGTFFRTRFERLGELNDLEDTISTDRAVVDLAFDGHPYKSVYLSNLGHSLKTRFDRLGRLSDLENAISRHREAIDITAYDHPRMPGHLNNLGICFFGRFQHLRELGDLEHAISILKDSVNLTPDGSLDKPPHLGNLGIFYLTSFKCLGELSDLEDAIAILSNAVRLTHPSHPDKPRRLTQLGDCFLARFEHLGHPRDLEDTISLYSNAASAPFGPIRDRFHASQKWMSCARHTRHCSLLHACSVSINLLPQLAWIGLSLEHRYSELAQGTDVVREAAAAALDAGLPETAVEWLERGRSIVWGELFQLRGSCEELSSAHPHHARRLCELSTALEHASIARERSVSTFSEEAENLVRDMHAGVTDEVYLSTLIQESGRARKSSQEEAQRHRTLAMERDKLLVEIRKLPGFERFLRRREFSQLHASAHAGPVVILNAAESRCDALIVLANVDHVIHVPLPRFTFSRSVGLQNMLEKLLGHARGMHADERIGKVVAVHGVSWESLLSTLWEDVVKHVLDALAFSSPAELSRIFWCPTGPFTFLPIHAAGLFDNRYPQHGHRVFDYVVSSYVPTLSILTPSSNPTVTPSDKLHLLVVRQPHSDGLSRLPGVVTELERIRELTRSSPSVNTTLVETSAGTVEEVLEMMKAADWVHFACHGTQDGVNSGLCLADKRRLRVRDIITLSRPRGGLAFLSACQTAMGDEHLSDEAIHIAAGMLFAGYEGVIGTMWSISDKLAPDVARDVYGQLLRNGRRPDHREAARALHEAIGRIRDGRMASFVTWLPFIHVGL